MNPIGGYFSIELPHLGAPSWLGDAFEVNSSRHALEYILMALPKLPSRIYIPYFTCEVVLEPIKRLGINYQFYHINQNLEVDIFDSVGNDELIIVNNYFGIKDAYIDEMLKAHGSKVIIDNAQAFYHIVDNQNRAIYSPRKFFGVSDGGYAITSDSLSVKLPEDFSTERFSHLLKRLDAGPEAGYADFHMNDSALSQEPLKTMSNLTSRILSSIDYGKVRDIRHKNFAFLHEQLAEYNRFSMPSQNSFACPMVYPFWSVDETLRGKLIANKIFVATYWPNVLEWCNKETLEYKFTKWLIPLPIDQRYNVSDMQIIVDTIKSVLS